MSDEASIKSIQDKPNYKFTGKGVIKMFISSVNSFYGKFIVSQLLSYSTNNGTKYEIYGTIQESQAIMLSDVEFLNPESESFLYNVTNCDVIVMDISHDKMQLQESKAIVNQLENLLTNGTELKVKLILISTVLIWTKTTHYDEILTDSNYRKRLPHPCFRIIYGEEQGIFHYIFKQCFFNHPYVDVFMPGVNYLPIIYIHDFEKIVLNLLTNFPDVSSNYILAVQPNLSTAFDIARIFAQAISGNEIMIRICGKEEIFAINIDEITQRTYNHMTLNLRLKSDYLKDFEFTINGHNLEDSAEQIGNEFYESRRLKPIKSPHTSQLKLAKKLSQFYCLHPIDHKCFLKTYQCRLVSSNKSRT
ncbi:unnamed protein product [Chironomus riparius]|uniref:Uncharacterized protein n=1 Tax=Chironomus riparius TaxID=315576 RepID=A0A9N9RWX0_9DIPT|nr:unnamed protein product [Chironomus riparius]